MGINRATSGLGYRITRIILRVFFLFFFGKRFPYRMKLVRAMMIIATIVFAVAALMPEAAQACGPDVPDPGRCISQCDEDFGAIVMIPLAAKEGAIECYEKCGMDCEKICDRAYPNRGEEGNHNYCMQTRCIARVMIADVNENELI